MTQGERVKKIRKTLGFTLEQFGEKVGVTKQTVSRIENGINNVTDQMTKSICREFNVDYIWLTTGEGEMFIETDDDFQNRIDLIMAGENDTRKNMIKALLYASDDDINTMRKLIDDYNSFANKKNKKTDTLSTASATDSLEQNNEYCFADTDFLNDENYI